MSTSRKVTVWSIRAVLALALIFDLVMALNGVDGDTISEVVLPFLLRWPWAFAAVFYTLGHLSWPQYLTKQGDSAP